MLRVFISSLCHACAGNVTYTALQAIRVAPEIDSSVHRVFDSSKSPLPCTRSVQSIAPIYAHVDNACQMSKRLESSDGGAEESKPSLNTLKSQALL